MVISPLTHHKLIVDVLTRFGPIKLLCVNVRAVGGWFGSEVSLAAPVKRNLDETANCAAN